MAKKKARRKDEGQIYLIGIKEPVEVRRRLLEASRELFQFLQKYVGRHPVKKIA